MAPFLVFLLFGCVVCTPVQQSGTDDEVLRALENPNLFEGDILGLGPNDDRNADPRPERVWTDGIIPYEITAELKDVEHVIKGAMQHIHDKTDGCLTFRPVTKKDDYSIKIYKGRGCFSLVGRVTGDQPLSLGNGCHMHPIAVHELMHAVGFYHEHSRSDRDDYLIIHWENIQSRFLSQFRKLPPSQNTLYDTFDYDSIMLYHDTVFSIDHSSLKTMTAKKPGVTIPNIYEKPGLSKSDVYRVKQMYKCK